MATKESKRQVKELIEGLEQRVHRGPPVHGAEIQSLKDYLLQNDFSPASDYFHRLTHLESRLVARVPGLAPAAAKRNYGGEAAGYQMQVQSVFDHVILSTCYAGEFNGKRGRVKLSHRFNQQGRIDFVELKYLRSLHPALDGELRKLLLVDRYSSIRKDWLEAPASVLRVLPQELIFLYSEVFRCERTELFAWLINIGHGLLSDLLQELRTNPACKAQGELTPVGTLANRTEPHLAGSLQPEPALAGAVCNGWQAAPAQSLDTVAGSNALGSGRPTSGQLDLRTLIHDPVAVPILQRAAALETVVEAFGPTEVLVRYLRRNLG